MRIGIFYRALLTAVENKEVNSIEDGIQKLKAAGVSYYEVFADDIHSKEEETSLLSLMENNKVSVGSLYFKKELTSSDKEAVDELLKFSKDKIAQCVRLHCKQLMPIIFINPNDEKLYKTLLEYYSTVSDISAGYGVSTVFENGSVPNTKSFTIDDVGKMLDKSSNLGYMLDTGNYWFSNENPISAVDLYKNKIQGVHLKDILPVENESSSGLEVHFTVLGKGISSIKETIKRMKSSGYEKGFTIELDDKGLLLPKIYDSIRFIRQSESEILFYLTAHKYYEFLFNYANLYKAYGDYDELKTTHMIAVANLMDSIATKLGVDRNLHRLAIITGLFHDVGRYEQYRQYKTFRDADSIDHADLSVEILKKENFFSDLSENERKMVLIAITNHNKYSIESGIDGDTLTLCKMIRDADKIDIFRVVCSEPFEISFSVKTQELENSKISEEVYNSIMRHELVAVTDRKYPLDFILCCLAFVFDINYNVSREIAKKSKYYLCNLDKLSYTNADTKKKIREIFEEVQNFLS